MSSSYSLGHRVRARSYDLHKYLRPGVGKRLLKHDEDHWGVTQRLPQHYKDYHNLWKKQPQEFIHIKPEHNGARWYKDEKGRVFPNHTPNVPVIYPREFHAGLWGGEGIVKGLQEPMPVKHLPNRDRVLPKYWYPTLHETVVYSEILDKYIKMHATKRGEMLVHKHFGFDHYLLDTPVNEVYAVGLLKIKREMLLALARPDVICPQNASKRQTILSKYERFVLSEEEADWHGLPLRMAQDKQIALEQRAEEQGIVPRKMQYQKELVQLLESGYMEDLDPSLLYADEEKDSTVKEGFQKIKKFVSRKLK